MFLTSEITASGRVGKRRPRSINGMRGREVLRFIEIRSLITDTDELGGRDEGGGGGASVKNTFVMVHFIYVCNLLFCLSLDYTTYKANFGIHPVKINTKFLSFKI